MLSGQFVEAGIDQRGGRRRQFQFAVGLSACGVAEVSSPSRLGGSGVQGRGNGLGEIEALVRGGGFRVVDHDEAVETARAEELIVYAFEEGVGSA